MCSLLYKNDQNRNPAVSQLSSLKILNAKSCYKGRLPRAIHSVLPKSIRLSLALHRPVVIYFFLPRRYFKPPLYFTLLLSKT